VLVLPLDSTDRIIQSVLLYFGLDDPDSIARSLHPIYSNIVKPSSYINSWLVPNFECI
jgi:hypothetical protein